MKSFSVVVPLYNKAEFIARALNSILVQTCLPLEIIVVDDGSTDPGKAVVEQVAVSSKVPICCISQPNKGASAARNTGIKLAKGEYVVFLDADDELLPGALAVYFELARTYPECGALGLNIALKRRGVVRPIRRKLAKARCSKVDYLRGLALGEAYLTASSACVRKDVFAVVGAFQEGLVQREDPHMWLRIAARYEIAFCSEVLAIYHQDDLTRICATQRATAEFADSILMKQWLAGAIPLSKQQKRYVLAALSLNNLTQAFQNLREGKIADARACLSLVKWGDAPAKIQYVACAFLAYSGTWVLLDEFIRYRFWLLAALRR